MAPVEAQNATNVPLDPKWQPGNPNLNYHDGVAGPWYMVNRKEWEKLYASQRYFKNTSRFSKTQRTQRSHRIGNSGEFITHGKR